MFSVYQNKMCISVANNGIKNRELFGAAYKCAEGLNLDEASAMVARLSRTYIGCAFWIDQDFNQGKANG